MKNILVGLIPITGVYLGYRVIIWLAGSYPRILCVTLIISVIALGLSLAYALGRAIRGEYDGW
jgi:hypothetical protein